MGEVALMPDFCSIMSVPLSLSTLAPSHRSLSTMPIREDFPASAKAETLSLCQVRLCLADQPAT